MKSGFVIDGIYPARVSYDVSSSVIQEVPCVPESMLQENFASNNFQSTKTEWTKFVFVSCKN